MLTMEFWLVVANQLLLNLNFDLREYCYYFLFLFFLIVVPHLRMAYAGIYYILVVIIEYVHVCCFPKKVVCEKLHIAQVGSDNDVNVSIDRVNLIFYLHVTTTTITNGPY